MKSLLGKQTCVAIEFSRDVTAAMLVSLNKGTAAMLVSLINLAELNSDLVQTISFVLVEKHAHWSPQ